MESCEGTQGCERLAGHVHLLSLASEAALMYSRHTESESQLLSPRDFSRGCLLFVLNTSASLSHLADPATDFELRRRRRTDLMDYGVPAALGVSPELMEEVSTGVSARPPFKKDVPSQIQPSFPPTTPFD